MAQPSHYIMIDASTDTQLYLSGLKGAGIEIIFRYYDHNDNGGKVIQQEEFDAILGAGFSLGIFHERDGTNWSGFGAANGTADAWRCKVYGGSLGQPAGSAIYFCVDFDASDSEVTNYIVPYFEAAKAEMARHGEEPSFKVGVYGSGLVCRTLLDNGLVDYTCLSNSTGFRGTRAFHDSMDWDVNQFLPTELCGLSIDPDIVNNPRNSGQFGQFSRAD